VEVDGDAAQPCGRFRGSASVTIQQAACITAALASVHAKPPPWYGSPDRSVPPRCGSSPGLHAFACAARSVLA